MKPEVSSETRLLTIKAAAQYLGATVWFVRSIVWEKSVPHLVLGKRIVIDRADLDKWIETRKRS